MHVQLCVIEASTKAFIRDSEPDLVGVLHLPAGEFTQKEEDFSRQLLRLARGDMIR